MVSLIRKVEEGFSKAEYPPNDCKFCTERHDYWAGWYRKASLKNRDYKNNGGLKQIVIKPAKNSSVRVIKKILNLYQKRFSIMSIIEIFQV